MSLLSREGVLALFNGDDVAGVPAPVSVVTPDGDPEVLRSQEGDADDAFGRQMMDFRHDIQKMSGGMRHRRSKTRKGRKSRSSQRGGGARKTQGRKNWLRVSASIRLRQQRRQ